MQAWTPYWALDTALPDLDGPRQHDPPAVAVLVPRHRRGHDRGRGRRRPPTRRRSSSRPPADRQVPLVASILDGTKAGVMAGILADPAQRPRHVDALVRVRRRRRLRRARHRLRAVRVRRRSRHVGHDATELGGLHRGAVATPARRWANADREHPARVRRRPDRRQRLLGLRLRRHHAARRHHPGDGLRLHGAVREPRSDRPAGVGASGSSLGGRALSPATRRSSCSASRCTATTGSVGTTGQCPTTAEGNISLSQRDMVALAARRGATPQFDRANYEMTFTYELEVSDGATTCTQSREVHHVDANGRPDPHAGRHRRRVPRRLAVRPRLRGPASWNAIDTMAAQDAPTTTDDLHADERPPHDAGGAMRSTGAELERRAPGWIR